MLIIRQQQQQQQHKFHSNILLLYYTNFTLKQQQRLHITPISNNVSPVIVTVKVSILEERFIARN